MKIRLSPDTLRVRLGRSELERLAQGQPLTLDLALPGQPLRVSVAVGSSDAIHHTHGHLHLTLAQPTLQTWAEGQAERYPFEAPDAEVRCDIERDFACTTPRGDGECEEDTFGRLE